jgi:hypothetical protein
MPAQRPRARLAQRAAREFTRALESFASYFEGTGRPRPRRRKSKSNAVLLITVVVLLALYYLDVIGVHVAFAIQLPIGLAVLLHDLYRRLREWRDRKADR